MKYKRSAYFTVTHQPELNHPTVTIALMTHQTRDTNQRAALNPPMKPKRCETLQAKSKHKEIKHKSTLALK